MRTMRFKSAVAVAGLVAFAGGGGCSWWGGDDKPEGASLDAGAFRAAGVGGAGGAAPAPGDVATSGTVEKPATTDGKAGAAAAKPAAQARVAAKPGDDGMRVVGVTGEPPKASGPATPSGRDVLADAMVGQVNGKPVYSSEMLDPLDGQLRALAAEVKSPATMGDWAVKASALIMKALRDRVQDELLLGEARSRLTPEQRQGLIYFLQRIDQYVTGQAGGSRERAEESIQAQTGDTYEQYLQNFRDKQMIKELIEQNVTPNVRVPWRKIVRFYNEDQDLFNALPRAVLRIVMVDGENADAVAKVNAAVSAKDNAKFAELGSSVINKDAELRAVGGRLTQALKVPYDQLKWVPNQAWNDAAAKLAPGDFSAPIEAATLKVYIHREADIPAKHYSLEDAELQIFASLRAVKQQQEEADFINRLLGKSSFTPVSRMRIELLLLAGQRHLAPQYSAMLRDLAPKLVDAPPELPRAPMPNMNENVDPRAVTPAK